MDEYGNKLYLYSGSNRDIDSNQIAYDLMTFNCEGDDFEPFYPIALDMICELMKNCVVVCPYHCRLKKAAKRRWLRPDRPAVFSHTEETEKVLSDIALQKLNWEYCWMEYADGKTLFVKTTSINEDFIHKNEGDLRDILIVGYLPRYFECEDLRVMAQDYLKQNHSAISHEAISISMAEYQTMLHIILNPAQYPMEDFINRVQRIAQKYHKILEVEI